MIKKIKEENDDASTGGQTGAIQFRDFLLPSDAPDDVLPETEIRRLLKVHEGKHKSDVDNQKRKRKERDDIKNGRVQAQQYDALGLRRGSGGGGGASPYKTHPLSNHAQFDGATDRKVTGVPSLNESEVNEADKNDLLNELNLTLQHKHVPKFNPKPRPF
jgi:hypothetical protein